MPASSVRASAQVIGRNHWPRFIFVLVSLAALPLGCNWAAPAQPAAAKAATPLAQLPIVAPPATATSLPTATPWPTATPTPFPTPVPPAAPSRPFPEKRPVAVVVENEMAARPQSGLAEADVVYEAVAEFSLTRFVAVFSDQAAETVGPVRSGRAYHTAIAAEYEAAFAHCLAVPTVAQVVAATKVFNLDGCRLKDPLGFRRDDSRRAPHNLYVSVPVLQKVAGGQGTYGSLGKRQPLVGGESVQSISFVYPQRHPVLWRYDPRRGEYLRWQDDAPHVDSAGRQLSAHVVVIQYVSVQDSVYYGEAGYHELTLTGQGQAIIYAGGGKRLVTWRRASFAEPTRYFDSGGREVLLPPGRVFVQMVALGTSLNENDTDFST